MKITCHTSNCIMSRTPTRTHSHYFLLELGYGLIMRSSEGKQHSELCQASYMVRKGQRNRWKRLSGENRLSLFSSLIEEKREKEKWEKTDTSGKLKTRRDSFLLIVGSPACRAHQPSGIHHGSAYS